MLILKMNEIFIYENTLKKNQYCVIEDDERETNYDIQVLAQLHIELNEKKTNNLF